MQGYPKKIEPVLATSENAPKFKLRVYNAVIRAKLMYGLETAQLNDSHLKRLNTSQLKGSRKIAKMDTTYVQRNNDNTTVYKKIHEIAN